jgi:hypothetical protein
MDASRLIDTINFSRHDFSLLLVDPKPSMLEWLRSFVKGKRLEKLRLYYPEGNLAVIIPKVDRFSVPGQLDEFINKLKPGLLRKELRRFQATPEDFGYSISADTFDDFFTVSAREAVHLITDFDLSGIVGTTTQAGGSPF